MLEAVLKVGECQVKFFEACSSLVISLIFKPNFETASFACLIYIDWDKS
jgi:hypothetical protein